MKSSRRQQEVAIMANGRVDKIAMFAEVEPRPLTGATWSRLEPRDKMWIQELGANVNAHSLLELSTILREVYQSPTGTCTINRHCQKWALKYCK